MNSYWQSTPLGNVLTERREKPSEEELATRSVRIVSKIGFNDGRIQLREDGKTRTGMILIRPGDLVVSGINAAKGAIAIYSKDEAESIAATIHYGAYIPNKNKVDVKYLWWLLRSNTFRKLLNQFVPGGIKTELKAKRLLPIPVPLPGLPEQQRIVTRIESLATKIEEARLIRNISIKEAGTLLASAMRRIFDFSKAKAKTSLGDFAKVLGGYAFSSTLYREDGSHQIVRIGNVRDGYLDLSRAPIRWDLQGDERIKRYELTEGDIVISMTGTRDKRDYGYVAIVPSGHSLLLNQRVGKIIPRRPVDRKYLAYFLRSPFFRDNLFPHATGTANQANIGNDDIERVSFAPPDSIDEQHKVVDYLDNFQAKVNELKEVQNHTIAELDALLPSILDKAFKGEL